jgi:thioredoxin 1
MPGIKHATEETFSDLVLNSDRPVAVDSWAQWSRPCKQMALDLTKLAKKHEGLVDIVEVDVDDSPSLASSFDIESIPTIAHFRRGNAPVAFANSRISSGSRPAACSVMASRGQASEAVLQPKKPVPMRVPRFWGSADGHWLTDRYRRHETEVHT